MIKEIRVRGFKSFRDLAIPFRPLTLLCGVNGSGKSSVMQLLLLLRAYALQADAAKCVKLKNDDIDLGRRKDVVYKWSSDGVVRIDLATDEGMCGIVSSEAGASENDFITFQGGEGCAEQGIPKEFLEKNVRYLSADRKPPQATHDNSAYEARMRNVGRHGENAVSLLYAYGQSEIPIELCHDGSEGNLTLNGQVNAWLGEVSHGVSVRTIPEGSKLRLDVDYGATKPAQGFRPENVGFGISYVLPVLVMILTAQKGDCLLIENPGAHLHPQGQAQLGRLIAQAAAYGVQLVIETHSDHVVNGIRVGCKKRAVGHAEECLTQDGVSYYNGAVINFFERITVGEEAGEEQYTQVTPIRIETDGELERYPEGFLDEWPNQMGELA